MSDNLKGNPKGISIEWHRELFNVVQLTPLSVIHFVVGAAIGAGLEKMQRVAVPMPSTEKERAQRAVEMAFEIALVVMLQVLAYVILQRVLRYVYRQTYKRFYGTFDDPSFDAHTIHGGMSMSLGLAWTSTTTIAKLQYITGTAMPY